MPNESKDGIVRVLHRLDDVQRAVEARIDSVEKKLDAFRDETLANFDEVYRRLDRLESEYQSLRAAVARLERRADDDAADRKRLREEIESLKARLADLEHRLDELESQTDDSHDA